MSFNQFILYACGVLISSVIFMKLVMNKKKPVKSDSRDRNQPINKKSMNSAQNITQSDDNEYEVND